MNLYARGLGLLALAVTCGLLGLVLPDGAAAGVANLGLVGLGLAGLGNLAVGAYRSR